MTGAGNKKLLQLILVFLVRGTISSIILQSVQNVAARLVLGDRHYDHMTRGSTLGGFQDGHPGPPVTVQHGSSLSSCRLPVGLRRRSSSSSAFCHKGRAL